MTQLDPETYQAVVHFATTLLQVLPDALGIDRIFPNCEVIDLDPYSEGSVPRYIQVSLKGREYIDVFWRGDPALEVGDYCTVIRFADGQRFEVFGAGGTTGKVLTAISQLSSYTRGATIRGGTSAWEALTIGAANTVLKSDGTDVAWGSVGHNELTGVTDSNHHNPITLDTNAETLLSLAAQVLGLDTQAANTALRGPASGADAVPTFRAAVNDDLPTINPSKLSPLLAENIFTAADGLLLLGPNCPITPTIWTSPRGQGATINGAFHQGAGPWPGTRGLWLERERTNKLTNPSLENGLDGWKNWSTGNTTGLLHYTSGGKFGDAAGQSPVDGATSIYTAATGTGAHALSAYVFHSHASPVLFRARCYNSSDGHQYGDWVSVPTYTWVRVEGLFNVSADSIWGFQADANVNWLWDGAMLVAGDCNTTYIDGDQGPGYTWDGTAHASTSTRASSQLSISAYWLNGLSTVTHSVWIKAQYAAGDPYPQDVNGVIAYGNNQVNYYGPSSRFRLYLNGAYRIYGNAELTFEAGDWIHIVATLDYDNDDYRLYVNGELVGVNNDALSPPTGITSIAWGGTYSGGWEYGEIAVLATVLSAEQVAALHHRNAPLVDVGAYDTPVVDGRHIRLPVSNYNVSNPPTDAELTSAFGLQPDGFTGLVDDAGAGTTIWKVWRAANNWWYEQLTQAS